MQANKQQNLLRLVESGLMLAMATVLSMVKVLDLPYGGSITAFSALPILLVAYRHGIWQGLVTACAHSLIQLMLGAGALSYATSATAAVVIVVLDYILAFTVLGLAGIFRKKQFWGNVIGTVTVCLLRFLIHFAAGIVLWANLDEFVAFGESFVNRPVLYSLLYNGSYMLPEAAITVVAAIVLLKIPQFKRLIKK